MEILATLVIACLVALLVFGGLGVIGTIVLAVLCRKKKSRRMGISAILIGAAAVICLLISAPFFAFCI